jgi:hypothetical protein
MKEKELTAVDWLIDEHFGGIQNCTPDFRNTIQQAKEMHKKQIINARYNGKQEIRDFDIMKCRSDERYYNETFKQQEHEDILCNCSQGKGIDFDEMGVEYCVSCQKQIN